LGQVVSNDEAGRPNPDFDTDTLGRRFSTLGYANGSGFSEAGDERPEVRRSVAVPLADASHSGADVPVYATGPGASLVGGVIEQNVIYHVLAAALGFD